MLLTLANVVEEGAAVLGRGWFGVHVGCNVDTCT